MWHNAGMWRRWVIRGLFAALPLLCAGAWVGSYVHSYFIDNWGPSTGGYSTNWQAGVWPGRFHYFYSHVSGGDSGSDWRCDRSLLGFVVKAFHTPAGGWESVVVDVPLWMPTVVAGLMLAGVWWWTGRHKERRGFSVEAGAGG